jgi:hypothetical protein
MKKHPIQVLLESNGVRTFSFSGRLEKQSANCLGAYCTLGGLLRIVSTAATVFNEVDLNVFLTDISGATVTLPRLVYWPNIKFVEQVKDAFTTENNSH